MVVDLSIASAIPARYLLKNLSQIKLEFNPLKLHALLSLSSRVHLFDHTNMEVDNYYMETKLTFSQCYIQISDSTASVQKGEEIKWAVDDLIAINCYLFPGSEVIIIKLCAVSSNAGPSNLISCTSGIEELKIAVVDSNWFLKHKQITYLNEKYFAIWNTTVSRMDVHDNENFPLGPRSYFSNFEESSVKVVYPKGDPDAVCLSMRDVDLLKPCTFINDTIVDFYIQYLKSKIQLVDMDKNPSSVSNAKAAFRRVLKEPDKSLKVPCILHMDSIKGYHSGLENLFQSYLWEEWKERQKDTCGVDLSSRFLKMSFLPVELPQQENSYDCGLFLLHYLELFLAEAPFNFNPFKLNKYSNFLKLDWFLPTEAYLKRTFIQSLIFELVENENHSSREGLSSNQRIESAVLSAASALDPQSFNPSSMVLKELVEQGAMAGTLLEHCQSLDEQSSDHCLNCCHGPSCASDYAECIAIVENYRRRGKNNNNAAIENYFVNGEEQPAKKRRQR
ncbi:putative ubiquitin-like-specific protease 2B, partial [Mucuna pruriens]